MIKVGLHEAEFFARHGYYKEEQILGNYFVVNIEASFHPVAQNIEDELVKTLNYEQLYEITTRQMKLTRQLLESVAQGIADDIMQQFPYIQKLDVQVKKRNPPLKGSVGSSSVTISV
ncbi:dihydroneopterin aldolase [Mucilaginibacter sp. PAMB04168]|uniref:dihydroneopterin aldolase n=1 Tax=Mucilaginibacter sp. PAMB04168 TaxID=3138567 RepID=UPI0031F650E4